MPYSLVTLRIKFERNWPAATEIRGSKSRPNFFFATLINLPWLCLHVDYVVSIYCIPHIFSPLLACRLIALDKCPGVRPIVVCELMIRRIITKAVLYPSCGVTFKRLQALDINFCVRGIYIM